MRDFHTEAMNVLLNYDPQGEKTLTACIADAILAAVKEEREECALLVEHETGLHYNGPADKIRARGDQ